MTDDYIVVPQTAEINVCQTDVFVQVRNDFKIIKFKVKPTNKYKHNGYNVKNATC